MCGCSASSKKGFIRGGGGTGKKVERERRGVCMQVWGKWMVLWMTKRESEEKTIGREEI